MNRQEEIALAFCYGAKSFLDRRLELSPDPPAHWPDHAKQEFRNGYSYAEERSNLAWGNKS